MDTHKPDSTGSIALPRDILYIEKINTLILILKYFWKIDKNIS